MWWCFKRWKCIRTNISAIMQTLPQATLNKRFHFFIQLNFYFRLLSLFTDILKSDSDVSICLTICLFLLQITSSRQNLLFQFWYISLISDRYFSTTSRRRILNAAVTNPLSGVHSSRVRATLKTKERLAEKSDNSRNI